MDIFQKKEPERQAQDVSLIDELQVNEETDQFDSVYGKNLRSPILGYHYELPDLPTSYVPSITLDTALLHIPVYTHLKIHDLKPVKRPKTPSILSALHLQFSEDARKFSREVSSIARASEEDTTSASYSIRDDVKIDTLRKNT
ncbi:WD repeat-containing protein on Y chromosome-like [Odontomachus brunneus]|uniref:WD repeat-containing protein on Y chromosome-like n=1 Tax=Odontomachus brunneus TaxID=486640 RepID=UPI0013F1DF18|nr:WD repeat-containing protein on Y chromosome-like [Odontomachus brunneus]